MKNLLCALAIMLATTAAAQAATHSQNPLNFLTQAPTAQQQHTINQALGVY